MSEAKRAIDTLAKDGDSEIEKDLLEKRVAACEAANNLRKPETGGRRLEGPHLLKHSASSVQSLESSLVSLMCLVMLAEHYSHLSLYYVVKSRLLVSKSGRLATILT